MSTAVTPALLYLDNVTVSFDGFRALNALSLTIDETEVLENAQAVYHRFVERAGLAAHTRNPQRFWGASRSELMVPRTM